MPSQTKMNWKLTIRTLPLQPCDDTMVSYLKYPPWGPATIRISFAEGGSHFERNEGLNSQVAIGGNELQVVAFDGHDLVVQITCQTGKDRLGRPHIEVTSGAVANRDIESTRAALAEKFAGRGWSMHDGKIACPTCAKRLTQV